ncbi:response regulator, partial [Candidatus Auribacterota bacterium]
VGEAYDGDEALELYRLTKPDVVLMDMMMPRFNGLKGIENIIGYDPQAKIIMLTALDGKDDVVKSIKLGACDYITKPFTPEEMITTLEKYTL